MTGFLGEESARPSHRFLAPRAPRATSSRRPQPPQAPQSLQPPHTTPAPRPAVADEQRLLACGLHALVVGDAPARRPPRRRRGGDGPTGPLLDPLVTLVVRGPRLIQAGLDPIRAVVIEAPADVPVDDLVWFLQRLDGTRDAADVENLRAAAIPTFAPEDLGVLLEELGRAGLLLTPRPRPTREVTIHGDGPLALGVRALLPGVNATESSLFRDAPVVVCDDVVPDPVLIHELRERRLPFLLATVADDVGWVGPLVGGPTETRCAAELGVFRVPGLASAGADAPAMAARLVGRHGRASTAILAATVGHTMGRLESLMTPGVSTDAVRYRIDRGGMRCVDAPPAEAGLPRSPTQR